MGRHQQYSLLLSEVNKEIEIADHLLNVTYPIAREARLLMGVMAHCKVAIEVALKIEGHQIPKKELIALHEDFEATIQRYEDSSMVFSRNGKFFITSEGFSYLRAVTPEDMEKALNSLKQFIYKINKYFTLEEVHAG